MAIGDALANPLLQLAAGQFGKKVQRDASVSLLLNADEFPYTDWIPSRTMSWRIGAFDSDPERRRAWKLGLFTAVRGFRQPETEEHLRIQVFRLSSASDAEAIARRFRAREIRRPGTTLLDEREVAGPLIPGLTESQFVESDIKIKIGTGSSWRVYGAVDSVALIVNASGLQDFWSWEKVHPVVVRSVIKVQGSPDEVAGSSEK
jgi:hypothetical protein